MAAIGIGIHTGIAAQAAQAELARIVFYWLGTTSAWETLTNWNSAADGSGESPEVVPWAAANPETFGWSLLTGTTPANAPTIGATLGVVDVNITGTSDLEGVSVAALVSVYNTPIVSFFENLGYIIDQFGRTVVFDSASNDGNYYEVIADNVEFRGETVNDAAGTVTGNAEFSGTYSANYGIVDGNTILSGEESQQDGGGETTGSMLVTGYNCLLAGGIDGPLTIAGESCDISSLNYQTTHPVVISGGYVTSSSLTIVYAASLDISGTDNIIIGDLQFTGNVRISGPYNTLGEPFGNFYSWLIADDIVIPSTGNGTTLVAYADVISMVFNLWCEGDDTTVDQTVTGNLKLVTGLSFYDTNNFSGTKTLNWDPVTDPPPTL